ncbi:hypothetical protein ACFQYP_09105 [Nonomuraea antimicrobica]
MKIRYLMLHAYGMGGSIRTVVNQANAMAAAGHDVELVSLVRRRDTPSSRSTPGSPSPHWWTSAPDGSPTPWRARRGAAYAGRSCRAASSRPTTSPSASSGRPWSTSPACATAYW